MRNGAAAGAGGVDGASHTPSRENSRSGRRADQSSLQSVAIDDSFSALSSSPTGSGGGIGDLDALDDPAHDRQRSNCCTRLFCFFWRPDVPSYFDLRAPLDRSIFARTMAPSGAAGEAARARAAGSIPVAYPVHRGGGGNGGSGAAAADSSAPRVAGVEEDFDLSREFDADADADELSQAGAEHDAAAHYAPPQASARASAAASNAHALRVARGQEHEEEGEEGGFIQYARGGGGVAAPESLLAAEDEEADLMDETHTHAPHYSEDSLHEPLEQQRL